jgi:uroporphyrinogen decarboxylase
MNSKERVRRTILRQETDRVPFSVFGTNVQMLERIRNHLNLTTHEDILQRLEIDMRYFGMLRYNGPTRWENGLELDLWGVPIDPSLKNCMNGDPFRPFVNISSVDEVYEYNWPSIDDFIPVDDIEENFECFKDYAIIGGVWAPVFHNMIWMCGFENALVLMASEPEIAGAIISKISNFWLEYTRKSLELGKGRIDIIENCNDFGTQVNTIISKEMFKEYFKPFLKNLYELIKSYDAIAFQHSCGAIKDIIPDLVEIGVDVLNPIQVSANGMNLDELKTDFGKNVTFCGGIDTQHLLPEGTPMDVRDEVRRVLGLFKEQGGYILCGSQGLEKDIPVENIIAMFDEGKIK